MIVEEFLKTYAEVLLHGSWLVVGIALVAGLLSSAICPFTVPVGLGVVGVVGTAESRSRGSGFPIAMAFFAGLVLSLTALGALAGVLGFVATQAIGQWWMLIMAALAFVAALSPSPDAYAQGAAWPDKPIRLMVGRSAFLRACLRRIALSEMPRSRACVM